MLKMLLKDLRISPLRTTLTAVSMFVGIVAVILSVLAGSVGDTYLKSTNEQLYGREPTLYAHLDDVEDSSANKLKDFYDQLLRRMPKAAFTVSPEKSYRFGLTSREAFMHGDDPSRLLMSRDSGNIETMFVSDSYNKVFNLPMTAGRWFLPGEDGRFDVVINKAARELSGDSPIAVISSPQTTRVSGGNVVGVVNDGVDSPRAYLNAVSAAHYLHDSWKASQMTVYIWNKTNIPEVSLRSNMSDLLYDTMKGRVSDIGESRASSVFKEVASAVQMAFAICAALLLFVSSLGLFNIGLASLEQRSRELLIRRALGATRMSIAGLVLGGSLLVAVLVSAVAILVTQTVILWLPSFLPADTPIAPPVFPFTAAVGAVSAAFITALLGSLVPAVRAAKLEPALALR